LIVAWGNVLELSPSLNGGEELKMWTNTARVCTLRLPFRDLSLIKSILYKNGRGSNPETIVEKSVDKHGQGMYPETTLSGFVAV
jgi:hypothetical protein